MDIIWLAMTLRTETLLVLQRLHSRMSTNLRILRVLRLLRMLGILLKMSLVQKIPSEQRRCWKNSSKRRSWSKPTFQTMSKVGVCVFFFCCFCIYWLVCKTCCFSVSKALSAVCTGWICYYYDYEVFFYEKFPNARFGAFSHSLVQSFWETRNPKGFKKACLF